MAAGADAEKFSSITRTQGVDDQAMTFLRAFVGEFQGKFEEILELAEEFKTFAVKMRGQVIQELDEFECHQFLEKKGLTKTVRDMRDELRAIDIDSNNRVAFIEFLLFTYKKTVVELFAAKPNQALLDKLEEAIRKYKAVFEERKKKAEQLKDLEGKAESGDHKAKAELRRMQMEDPSKETKNEMDAIVAKLAAQRALRSPEAEAERMYEAEQKRIAEETRKKEDDEKLKRQQSKDRLAAKAALFGAK